MRKERKRATAKVSKKVEREIRSDEGEACVEKNSSPTSARDKATIEYIRGRQPSPDELAFGVELGPGPHSINVKWNLDPWETLGS
ncbi:hypothetical protein GmHk_07G020908 [Glycine max]|nr:hypothetical protein GmHk_07G020908 [Glycine max]